MIRLSSCFCALFFSRAVFAVAVSSSASSGVSGAIHSIPTVTPSSTITSTAVASSAGNPPPPEATDPVISLDPNDPLLNTTEPIRGSLGAPLLGPTDPEIVQQNPDLLAPPTTDHGSVQNAKWPFSLSHNRLQSGGWAREQNVDEMPIATQMAGVNMRLEAGAIRELHWHSTAEWAYVLKGSTQITSVDSQGRNYIATVNEGDLWYFPPGIPHSLQATGNNTEGSEFLLVFDSGTFSEDSTFLVTDWLAHVPVEILEKNFRTTASSFQNIPSEELYIFPAALPDPDSDEVPTQLSGGTVKVVDTSTFAVSTAISAAEVTVEPGAISSGQARMTIFAAQSNARTFDYQAGDIGYVPATMGHYVENIGNETLHYLEIFNTDVFQDVSLAQWLALTPPKLVEAHLGLPSSVLANIPKTKQTVIGPSSN
ncbi:hypothetical protein H0H92_014629 [Tricholoma furcatifolium]|nr:hypothetical protein H0H92_014629 [Tricholoma furcatifolium]